MDHTTIEIHEDGDELLPAVALLVDRHMRHVNLLPAKQATGHGAIHDAMRLVPGDPHDLGGSAHRLARLQRQNHPALKGHREP
jgi:hypothetical protein